MDYARNVIFLITFLYFHSFLNKKNMTPEFFATVKDMRRFQKLFAKTGMSYHKEDKENLEKEVDKMIEAYLQSHKQDYDKYTQDKLFR
jgi:DNA topoisomerase IA